MRGWDPVEEAVSAMMETLTRRPHVRAAAFVWDHAAPIVVRAAPAQGGADPVGAGVADWGGPARGPRIVMRITGAYLAVAKVDGEGAVWVLFDEEAMPERELEALGVAADLVGAHLDQILGRAEEEIRPT